MATDPSIPTFKPGDPLRAADLNAITGRLRKPVPSPGALITDGETGFGVRVSRQGARPLQTFYARITAFLPVAGQPNRWTYAWEEAIKAEPGYGGWDPRPDGLFGLVTGPTTARNFREEMNSASGIQGHGININPPQFPAGFATVPCPVGQIVLMSLVLLANGSDYEYWFDHINAVDGSCS